jgi:predicted nuclease of predicted toxin-antitoxin system
MARIKVDEDLPRHIAEIARDRGHDATSVLDQGWRGTPDDALCGRVQRENRWLITADKAFGDLRRYAPGTHPALSCCDHPNRTDGTTWISLQRYSSGWR